MTSTTSRLAGYRERRDEFFRSHDNSPLTDEQRADFAGLRYFPENPDLSFTLEIDDTGPGVGESITVGTLSGEAKEYVRAGRIHFEADGQPVTLSVFKDRERGRYFMPFRDGTAGEETYAVGRYLDPKARPDGSLVVDFNLAYNPFPHCQRHPLSGRCVSHQAFDRNKQLLFQLLISEHDRCPFLLICPCVVLLMVIRSIGIRHQYRRLSDLRKLGERRSGGRLHAMRQGRPAAPRRPPQL
jgi:hypothetical protein